MWQFAATRMSRRFKTNIEALRFQLGLYYQDFPLSQLLGLHRSNFRGREVRMTNISSKGSTVEILPSPSQLASKTFIFLQQKDEVYSRGILLFVMHYLR